MNLRLLVRTALFRLTLIYAAVFLGSALVLAIGGTLFLSFVLEADIREEVEATMESLTQGFDRYGVVGVVQQIASLQTAGEYREFDYLLQNANGEVVAGSLPKMLPVEGWTSLVPPNGEADEPAFAKGMLLPDGSYLLVARDAELFYETRDFVLEMLGWGFGLALPLGIGGGFIASFVTLSRINTINRTVIDIRSGHLRERIPISDVDDEFNRLAENINAMLDGIEELNEGLRQVTSDIAHDLRTPLTRLRQDLERARKDPQTECFESLIESSISQIDDVLNIFSSLLRISQIESDSGRKPFASLDLSCLFRDLTEIFQSVAEDSAKILDSDIANGLSFFGDKTLLRQMIVNLIENAIQHTQPGTRILVELQKDAEGSCATIADNGPGIPEWARDRAFRRFFRLDESRQRPGNGLGMSLVAAIARYHGITVKLEDNRPGLRVVLRFPEQDRDR